MPNLGGQTLGKYQILERLGRGGMATVYRAYQSGMDRIVAVKVLHQQHTDDPSFVERFRREARSAGALRHPNIVQGIVRAEPDPQRYKEPFCNPRFNHQLDADEARILALMGRTDEAIEAFQRAIAATQDWVSPYVELAALYDSQGEREKASDLIRMALNLPRAQTDQALRGQLEALLAQHSSTSTPTAAPTAAPIIVTTPQPLSDPVSDPAPPTQMPQKGDDDDDDD